MIGYEVQATLVLKVCQEVIDPKSYDLSSRFGVQAENAESPMAESSGNYLSGGTDYEMGQFRILCPREVCSVATPTVTLLPFCKWILCVY